MFLTFLYNLYDKFTSFLGSYWWWEITILWPYWYLFLNVAFSNNYSHFYADLSFVLKWPYQPHPYTCNFGLLLPARNKMNSALCSWALFERPLTMGLKSYSLDDRGTSVLILPKSWEMSGGNQLSSNKKLGYSLVVIVWRTCLRIIDVFLLKWSNS